MLPEGPRAAGHSVLPGLSRHSSATRVASKGHGVTLALAAALGWDWLDFTATAGREGWEESRNLMHEKSMKCIIMLKGLKKKNPPEPQHLANIQQSP